MLLRRVTILLSLTAIFFVVNAQLRDARANADGFFLKGIVRDSVTAEPMAKASVMALPSARAVITDDGGLFGLAVNVGDTLLKVSSVGYRTVELPVNRNSHNLIVAYLVPSTTYLDELIVKKTRYSKKNNPAVDFVNRLQKSADIGNPEAHEYYNYNKYERITLALNDFDPNADNFLLRRYPFLKEYVDTSEVSGKPILNVSVKEKTSTINYRRKPKAHRTTITGFTTTGIDEVSSSDNTQVYLEEVLREVDIYDKDITLLQNRFVSPLSPLAPDFYHFYLTDTVTVGLDSCAVLSFYPAVRASFGFTGHLYVALNDSAMTVRKIEMSVPREINLNFVEQFYLTQTYENAPDGTRLKTRDDLTLELAPLPGMPSLYVRRNTSYGSHSFDLPADPTVFDGLCNEFVNDSVDHRSERYWETARMTPLAGHEGKVGEMIERFGSSKLFDIAVKVFSAFVQGYVPLGKKFDYGPINTTVSFNAIEGTRFRIGGMTTAGLSPRWFARGFVAYGLSDHKWKYKGEVEYSFHDKKHHSREFPVHSFRLSQLYDIDYVGQHYLFTNPDNVFLSLKRMTDKNVIYHRVTDLTYTLELYNNFSVTATLKNDRRESTRWIPFVDGYGNSLGHFTENSFKLTLRYAPGEKFYQSRSSRSPVNLDAPIFVLSQTFAPQAFSKYPINKTEFSAQKRIWFSAFGYLDAMVEAAKVWSRSSFLDLIMPNANLSYTIQPESFALLNPMEFINDSQVSWFLTYSPNGLLFNAIPGLKKAKLRESFSFCGFYGRLSDRNVPDLNPALLQFPPLSTISRMTAGPYMEFSVGVDNIFRCLRVDYVWRLSYRHPGYNVDRSGLRIAFHATF